MVDNDRQILVAAFIINFINPNPGQIRELIHVVATYQPALG